MQNHNIQLCRRIHMKELSELPAAELQGNKMTDQLKKFHGRNKCHSWAGRCRRIVETLYLSRADIICLQEVQIGSRQVADAEYEKEDIMMVQAKTEVDTVQTAAKPAQNDKLKIDKVEMALSKCTDWLLRYKKRCVITAILKDMKIYDSARGSQRTMMKLCDIFQLSASKIEWLHDSNAPAQDRECVLRDFGLRGKEPQDFLTKLTIRANEPGWTGLLTSQKLDEISRILDEMKTINHETMRPWNVPSSVSQLVDYFQICDDDLGDVDWCCLQLRLTPEETEDFKRRLQMHSNAGNVSTSIAEADAWHKSLDSRMKLNRFGHPGYAPICFCFYFFYFVFSLG
jgi:hypothetical protein